MKLPGNSCPIVYNNTQNKPHGSLNAYARGFAVDDLFSLVTDIVTFT